MDTDNSKETIKNSKFFKKFDFLRVYLCSSVVAKPWFLLIFFSLASVVLQGYYFGIANQDIFIPFVKNIANPLLYPNDFGITAMVHYHSYFFPFVGYLAKWLDLKWLFLILHLLTIYLTVLAIFWLTRAMFKDKLTSYLALLFFLTVKASLAGVPVGLNYGYFNPTAVVFPVAMFAIYFFIKEKYALAFLLNGAIFNFHAYTGSYLFLMFGLSSIFLFGKIHKREFLFSVIFFLLAIIPVSIHLITNPVGGNIFSPIDAEWLNILRIRFPHERFPSYWGWNIWGPFLFLCFLGLFGWKYKPEERIHKKILIFILAILLMCFGGTLFTEIFPLKFGVLFNFFRSTQFLLLFSLIYFAHYLSQMFGQKKVLKGVLWGVVSFGVVFWGFSPQHFLKKESDFLKSWETFQIACKKSTSVEEIFIIPPYLEGFRTHSERGMVVSWKIGSAVCYNREYALEWWRRMQDFGYTVENARYFSWGRGRPLYERLAAEDFRRLAKKYNASYVAVQKPKELDFEQVYQNQYFRVYKIRTTN